MACATMHAIFEFHLIKNNHDIYTFVQVENLLITFFFLLMSYFVYISRRYPKLLYINLFFWLLFESSVLLFKPTISTLHIVKEYLPLDQWIILSICGGITIVLNIIEINKLSK